MKFNLKQNDLDYTAYMVRAGAKRPQKRSLSSGIKREKVIQISLPVMESIIKYLNKFSARVRILM